MFFDYVFFYNLIYCCLAWTSIFGMTKKISIKKFQNLRHFIRKLKPNIFGADENKGFNS